MTAEPAHVGRADRLTPFEHAWATVHREMVAWLAIPAGARLLDAGCGAGAVTALLARAAGPTGAVTPVEINTELLAVARGLCETAPVAATAVDINSELLGATRVTVPTSAPLDPCAGSVLALPFADGAFDLVWCSRVIHGVGDQLAAVRELARVTRPGGRVVLREGGLAPRVLPFDVGIGMPGLEERMYAADRRWFARFRRSLPDHRSYPHGWARLLRDAGCVEVTAKSFLLEALPPFTAEQLRYIETLLRGPLDHPDRAPTLHRDDRHTLELLLDAGGPHYALDRTDLHLLAVGSIYAGRVPG